MLCCLPSTLRYNPSLGYENPIPYLNGSDLAAATTLGAIPVANRTVCISCVCVCVCVSVCESPGGC